MLWKEVKSWCKEKGYKADRKKIEGSDNSYHYTWVKIEDESISGEASSVSKLAFAIYNHITDNKHIEYQEEYRLKLLEMDIEHDPGFGFQ